MNEDHKAELKDIAQMSPTAAYKATMDSFTTEYRDRLIIAGEAVLADTRPIKLSASLWGVLEHDLNNYCCFHLSEDGEDYQQVCSELTVGEG